MTVVMSRVIGTVVVHVESRRVESFTSSSGQLTSRARPRPKFRANMPPALLKRYTGAESRPSTTLATSGEPAARSATSVIIAIVRLREQLTPGHD